jgi:nicotinate-nucleotide adenylyltransferase
MAPESEASRRATRVALYGGSFNPPHVAHQMVALYVLETAPVDELWLMPAYEHALGKPLAPFADRLAMCQLAAAALGPRVIVSDIERTLGAPSRTLRTIHHLRELHPAHEFSLVIGADLLSEVATWFGGAELQATVPFVVVGRAGTEGVADEAAGPVKMPALSSTEVRRSIAAGEPVEGLVPRVVLDYIYRQGLYKGREQGRA